MEQPDLKPVILDHFSRYPEMQVEDLYKLAHQAAMGSEHAVVDVDSARKRLVREITQLPETSAETQVDIITPDNSIARIHLKPYIESGRKPDDLLQAFLQTGQDFVGSTDLLRTFWKEIQELAQQEAIPFQEETLCSFLKGMEERNFPAVHHSKTYQQLYQPSYRVVALKFFTPGNS